MSLLNSAAPASEALIPELRLEFQPTLNEGSAESTLDKVLSASQSLSGQYLLIVDGSIPFGATARMTVLGVSRDGAEITAQDLVGHLAQRARAVVALGTCAAFGGIPSASPNPGGYRGISELIPASVPLVRVPGCPPHPGWIVETLTAVLSLGIAGVALDALGRPVSAFGQILHEMCPRSGKYELGDFADAPGDPSRCLFLVGCKGPETRGDCTRRRWNGRSSCIDANHPCLGCTSPGFPDARPEFGPEGQSASSPFYMDR